MLKKKGAMPVSLDNLKIIFGHKVGGSRGGGLNGGSVAANGSLDNQIGGNNGSGFGSFLGWPGLDGPFLLLGWPIQINPASSRWEGGREGGRRCQNR